MKSTNRLKSGVGNRFAGRRIDLVAAALLAINALVIAVAG